MVTRNYGNVFEILGRKLYSAQSYNHLQMFIWSKCTSCGFWNHSMHAVFHKFVALGIFWMALICWMERCYYFVIATNILDSVSNTISERFIFIFYHSRQHIHSSLALSLSDVIVLVLSNYMWMNKTVWHCNIA